LREEKSKTIVAILHDLNLADTFCDMIILMKNGEIFAQGGTNEILTLQNLKAVYGMDFEFVQGSANSKRYIAVRYNIS
jgi:iron complex transport system ATP-binding protein